MYTWILRAAIAGCATKRRISICAPFSGARWMWPDRSACCSALIRPFSRAGGTRPIFETQIQGAVRDRRHGGSRAADFPRQFGPLVLLRRIKTSRHFVDYHDRQNSTPRQGRTLHPSHRSRAADRDSGARAFARPGWCGSFPQGWNERARRFQPGCHRRSAGAIAQAGARRLAVSNKRVIAFTYAGGPGVSPPIANRFGRLFGVPVFEQYLSSQEPAAGHRVRRALPACTWCRAARASRSNTRSARAGIRRRG